MFDIFQKSAVMPKAPSSLPKAATFVLGTLQDVWSQKNSTEEETD